MVKFLFFLLSLSSLRQLCAQQQIQIFDSLAKRLEKAIGPDARSSIYLATNKDIYVAGEDLWFNAVVLDAQHRHLSDTDKTLYVQLVNQYTDSVAWQEIYSIHKGLANGHVYLPQTLGEGMFQLRAYSAHSWSPGHKYFYQAVPVRIVSAPRAIRRKSPDWSHKEKPAPGMKLGIFPEGGQLVANVENRVAVQAANSSGIPVEAKATVLKNNRPVLSFTTSRYGTAAFKIVPEPAAQYTIRFDASDTIYAFPKTQEKGMAIQVLRNTDDTLSVRVISSGNSMQKIYLRLQSHGLIQSIASASVSDSILVRLPVVETASGVSELILLDEQFRTIAGRLVYLHQNRRLSVHVSGIKDDYTQKDQVTLNIRTIDERGLPVPAALSMRVFDNLFANAEKSAVISSHFMLSTYIRGEIYDPASYFDTTNAERAAAMDLLLLTSGRGQYAWSEEVLAKESMTRQMMLTDSIAASFTPIRHTKKDQKLNLMAFNYNKSQSQVMSTNATGQVLFGPEQLTIGSRFFTKYFSENEYKVTVIDPFQQIRSAEEATMPYVIIGRKHLPQAKPYVDSSDQLQYGSMMEAVTVSAKGRGYNDRYLGYLDSVARFEGNTDYVGVCGWLNCPADPTDKKPVEGQIYSELTDAKRQQVSSHPFQFGNGDYRSVKYEYPKYTEEELLKKFKMAVIKGYYQSRKFYEPDYKSEDRSVTDQRNTIAWNPLIITNEKGEVTIRFYTSDIRSGFIGIIEGVGGDNLLGSAKFSFGVH